MKTLRDLLGVRTTICSDLILIESNEPSATALLKSKQLKYIRKIQSRPDFNTSYLQKIIRKAIEAQCPMGKYIQQLRAIHLDPVVSERECLRSRVNENLVSSRRSTYKQLNPDLESPAIYTSSTHFIIEHHRIAYTQFRLSSHRLKIETGRWSRVPRERRLCSCGSVQDELHVLVHCPMLTDIRRNFSDLSFNSLGELMMHDDLDNLCKYIFLITNRVKELNAT